MEQTNTTPPAQAPRRWATLTAKYGLLGAIKPYFVGERPPKVSEREPKLTWYVQALVYATSLATLFVFGVSEIYLILHYGWSVISIILGIPLGLLLIMVYAMDRSFARTIPRIGILAQRRQYGLLVEHIAYVVCVGAIEAFTYGLVIYTLENNINALLHGGSIIPAGIGWLLGLIAARAVLLIWTIGHAHLTSEDLQVQWGTIERQGVELLGGNVLMQVQSIDLQHSSLGQKMKLLMLFLRPVPRAPWSWNRRERQAAQAALDDAHRQAIVDAFIQMDAPPPTQPVATPEVTLAPPTNGHHVPEMTTPEIAALPEADVDEVPGQMNELAPLASVGGTHSQPRPQSQAFLTLLKNTARTMLQDHQPFTVYAFTERLNVSQEDLLEAIRRLVVQVRNKLKAGQAVKDDAVLALGMLLEQPTPTR
jgi:hypothetical protein